MLRELRRQSTPLLHGKSSQKQFSEAICNAATLYFVTVSSITAAGYTSAMVARFFKSQTYRKSFRMHCIVCDVWMRAPHQASGTLVICHTRAHRFPVVTLYAAPLALTFINNQIISYSCIAFVCTEAFSAKIETTHRKTLSGIRITFTSLTSQNIYTCS